VSLVHRDHPVVEPRATPGYQSGSNLDADRFGWHSECVADFILWDGKSVFELFDCAVGLVRLVEEIFLGNRSDRGV
jgi:hypothetical protein